MSGLVDPWMTGSSISMIHWGVIMKMMTPAVLITPITWACGCRLSWPPCQFRTPCLYFSRDLCLAVGTKRGYSFVRISYIMGPRGLNLGRWVAWLMVRAPPQDEPRSISEVWFGSLALLRFLPISDELAGTSRTAFSPKQHCA